MSSKPAKKRDSSNRVASDGYKEAASTGAAGRERQKIPLWPEWNDADINGEKWEAPHKGKEKDKGKSPVVQHFFDDPEGRTDIPLSLRLASWKRPTDFIFEKQPVVVDQDDGLNGFNLLKTNEHIIHSELIRWIVSQIGALWRICKVHNPLPETPDETYQEYTYTWKPWEHIFAINKVTKGPYIPVYNPYGKYAVKLYWMGCWRKIIVDDSFPFDEQDRCLFPTTALDHELWPMLLTKAICKIASLDYGGGKDNSEFGDVSIIHCLTGWLPEAIPLHTLLLEDQFNRRHISKTLSIPTTNPSASDVLDQLHRLTSTSCSCTDLDPCVPKRSMSHSATCLAGPDEPEDFSRYGHMVQVWNLLKTVLPEWKLPEPEPEKPPETAEIVDGEPPKEEAPKTDKDAKPVPKDGKPKGKDEKKKGDKEKGDKDKKGEKGLGDEERPPVPDTPELVMFASYSGGPKLPPKVSLLSEMADASERLRQCGLSHMYPHPVLITQTRSCPLEPPPPPEKIPAWKLIRPKKKKVTPSDEAMPETPPPKPIQCVEITSPFVNYKVSPIPIPTETHRPKSVLERGGSRPATSLVNSIIEADECIPEPDTVIEPPKADVIEEPPQTEAGEALDRKQSSTSKPGTPGSKKKDKAGSAASKKEKEAVEAKKQGSPVKDRRPSALGSRGRAESVGKSSKPEGGKTEVKSKASADSKHMPEQPSAVTTAIADIAGDEQVAEEEIVPEIPEEPSKPINLWMNWEDFAKCFRTLYIFHKPDTYLCNHKVSDLKKLQQSDQNKDQRRPSVAPQLGKGDKKSVPSTAAPPSLDDRAPQYLFVDNLKPTEIIVSFSSLSRWHEGPPIEMDSPKKESKTAIKGGKESVNKEPDPGTASSVMDAMSIKERLPPPPVQSGLLVAEPYSWKSLVTGQPILRLRSTSTRAAVLSLPEGRHLLRFNITAPLGYHVHLSSTVNFVYGDEEMVMPHLTKESCRFVDNATQVIINIGKAIQSFSDQDAYKQAFSDLIDCHCPYRKNKLLSKVKHFQLFNNALYETLKKGLVDALTPEMAFAWRAFNFDATTRNILGIAVGSRPATGATSHRGSASKNAKKQAKQQGGDQLEKTQPDNWANREPTVEEHVACIKIQKCWRGCFVRKIRNARIPGTGDHEKVTEQLNKAWLMLEPSAELHGLNLFRIMFSKDPDLMSRYPFHKDEWNKIAYADHSGTHPDQPAHSWFVVFREIFHVTEEMLVVPKLHTVVPMCMLRVINNDTREEIPRVFGKVAPCTYKRNRRGYTFVSEARTTDNPLASSKWRMRLIGSLTNLPAPARPEVNSSFHTRELRDYYLPNEKNIVFRYTVKVHEDHLVSLQMNTSKLDVYIKLQILDHEEEVVSSVGKGHVTIPAYIFLRDKIVGESQEEQVEKVEDKRASSRSSNKGKAQSKARQGSGMSRSGSHAEVPGLAQRASSRSTTDLPPLDPEEEEKESKPHKFIIQATVLRNSWPLSESSWAFVQMLKEQEKNELRVFTTDNKEERPPSPAKNEKAGKKDKGGKGDKGSKGDKKDKAGSRPSSQHFDNSKPNWTLRIVSDGPAYEDIDVKKDTERADEIRAMKKAWEEAEPGRAAKAMQSRLNYLKTHMIKVHPEEEDVSEEGAVQDAQERAHTPTSAAGDVEDKEEILTLEPPPPPTPKEILQPLDITPFLRKTSDVPRYKDEAEIKRQADERQQKVAEYRAFRERVENWRENDRVQRNLTKQRQLEECRELQARLDQKRNEINIQREAFRQKYLDAERKRLDEITAAEAMLLAEQEAASPKKGSAKGKKSPAGKKKK